jgi:hypothetical protein
MHRKVAVLVAVALTVVACSSTGATGARRSSSSVITAEDLAEVPELNCYEAVQRLRPSWLRTRGRVSMSGQQGIRLYVDGISRGYVEELASIRANAVERMRHLSGPEATSRFGTDHGDGAILVTLKRG